MNLRAARAACGGLRLGRVLAVALWCLGGCVDLAAAHGAPWLGAVAPSVATVRRSYAAQPPAEPSAGRRVSHLSPVQVAYLTSCGGCHGVEGVSAPRSVPTLRHLTGSFLCTHQGRQFLVRLPDVALSSLSDRMLTRVMNWVVFDLGGPASQGPNSRPYTVAEVRRLRREPLTQTGLTRYRNQVVARLQARCAAPAALSVYGSTGYGPGVKSDSRPNSDRRVHAAHIAH